MFLNLCFYQLTPPGKWHQSHLLQACLFDRSKFFVAAFICLRVNIPVCRSRPLSSVKKQSLYIKSCDLLLQYKAVSNQKHQKILTGNIRKWKIMRESERCSDVPLYDGFLPIMQPFLHKMTMIANTKNSPPPTVPTIKPTSYLFSKIWGVKVCTGEGNKGNIEPSYNITN